LVDLVDDESLIDPGESHPYLAMFKTPVPKTVMEVEGEADATLNGMTHASSFIIHHYSLE
jgi:hypothetical protein